MRFMTLVKASKNSEASALSSEKPFAEMATLNEKLTKVGVSYRLGGWSDRRTNIQ